MKSARINFGLPKSEYIAEVNDQGAAISFRNQDTDTEYIGSGGLPTPTAADVGKSLTVQMMDGTPTWVAEEYPGWDVVIQCSGGYTDPFADFEFIKGSFDIALGLLAAESPRPLKMLICKPGNSDDGYETANGAVVLSAAVIDYGEAISFAFYDESFDFLIGTMSSTSISISS